MTREENEKRIERLKNIVLNMPDKPGSYQFYDADHTIIYVGKAKRLKQRVSSYFHKEVDRFKTKVLVSKIEDISYTVVNTEEDALLLENSLIKKYNPRYNVLLKDGKTYPSICITNEYLPRVFKTRQINKRFGTFFGPYSHTGSMFAVLELIHKLYKPRTCRMPITKEGIEQGKYKPCLEYHIHNCKAPCCGKQSLEDYQASIAQAREILKGNTRELSQHVFEEMQQKAAELKFEEAEELKQKYMLIESFCAKSEVVSHTITDVDVFTIVDDEHNRTAFINYIHVKNGSVTLDGIKFTSVFKRSIAENEVSLIVANAGQAFVKNCDFTGYNVVSLIDQKPDTCWIAIYSEKGGTLSLTNNVFKEMFVFEQTEEQDVIKNNVFKNAYVCLLYPDNIVEGNVFENDSLGYGAICVDGVFNETTKAYLESKNKNCTVVQLVE